MNENQLELVLASSVSAAAISNGEVGLSCICSDLCRVICRLPATHQTRTFFPPLYHSTAGVSLATATENNSPLLFLSNATTSSFTLAPIWFRAKILIG